MSETLSVKEILISELQSRILVEVYLAHGPVDIFRLWSEMFERQKSISSGLLSFTRAIVQLEDEGYLQKVAEMNSALAPKGEMYLIGAVLSGELPEGCWEKLSSTQNILDVAPQQAHKTKAVNHESGTGEVGLKTGEGCARKPLANTNSDTQLISENSNTYGGVAVSPAAPNILDVAGQASGNAPLTDGFQVGSKRVSGGTEGRAIALGVSKPVRAQSVRASSEYQASPADSQFQGTTIDELLALVASKLPDISLSRQHELEEIEAEREGGDTAASGCNDPASDRSFA